MNQEIVIAVHNCQYFVTDLKSYLPDTITVLEKKSLKMIPQILRVNSISCIILRVEQCIPDESCFERIKKKFPHVPWIAVFFHQNMELARHCGRMGIESVIHYDEIEHIMNEILRVRLSKNNKTTLEDVSINIKNAYYSEMIREALSIIERRFLKILNINEVSDLMEIAEATLSREFAKFDLPGPKKILMYLKVHHAIKLMRNDGLNIREISSLSGFTDEKRMAECFHRMFGMSPGKYRIKCICQNKQ
jgi:AraC-like DNA-binding protein